METNQVNVPPQARNPNWWPNRWNDRIKFEWPWLRAAVLLALVYALAMQAWPSSIIWGLISAFCTGLCGLAMGLRPERKSLAIIPAVLGVAAAAGLLLPAFVVRLCRVLYGPLERPDVPWHRGRLYFFPV